MNRRHLLGLACGAALLLAACGSDDESTDSTTAATEAAAGTEAAASPITITGAWARTSPMMATAGAAYMQITSSADDALLSAAVDATIAPTVEIHETVMAEGGMTEGTGMTETTMTEGTGMATGTTMAPAMEMRPVESIALPAGETVSLQPGGYHIMLLDLVSPLEIGQTFTITLTFEQAGEVPVDVVVADEAP